MELASKPAFGGGDAQDLQWLAPPLRAPAGAACGAAPSPPPPGTGSSGDCGDGSALREADRQLRLLGRLKAHVQAVSSEAAGGTCATASPPRGASPTAPPTAGPCDSLLLPNASAGSLLAEDSRLMLDNLGLPLLGPADDDAPGLHMALMGPE